jgi:hypothetical protein
MRTAFGEFIGPEGRGGGRDQWGLVGGRARREQRGPEGLPEISRGRKPPEHAFCRVPRGRIDNSQGLQPLVLSRKGSRVPQGRKKCVPWGAYTSILLWRSLTERRYPGGAEEIQLISGSLGKRKLIKKKSKFEIRTERSDINRTYSPQQKRLNSKRRITLPVIEVAENPNNERPAPNPSNF